MPTSTTSQDFTVMDLLLEAKNIYKMWLLGQGMSGTMEYLYWRTEVQFCKIPTTLDQVKPNEMDTCIMTDVWRILALSSWAEGFWSPLPGLISCKQVSAKQSAASQNPLSYSQLPRYMGKRQGHNRIDSCVSNLEAGFHILFYLVDKFPLCWCGENQGVLQTLKGIPY